MQQFDYTVVHVEGAGDKHAIADCISRLHGPHKQATLSTAAISPPAETVFWKKPGAGPSTQKRGVISGRLGPKGSGNAPAFWVEGAEIGFLCCPVWQGKLLKTQIIIFADR